MSRLIWIIIALAFVYYFFIKEDKNAGHNQERALSFFSILNRTPVNYFPGYIEHVQADSHKTQGHEVKKQLIL